MAELNYFTAEGLENLKRELHRLRTEERYSISKQIAEAREKGDLSENAEYDAAKEAQGLLELKIAKMTETLSQARLVDESKMDSSSVMILSNVKVKNLKNGGVFTYMLVSETEADLKTGKISLKSPIGSALIGKAVGDVVEITVPAGKMELQVLEISR
jgi:transcription elongation factor GreA